MLVDKILDLLKQEIPQIEFERYIKQLSYDEEASRSDIAIFYAPNPLVARWVKTRYGDKLSHLFELKTGIKPQIVVEVKNNKKRVLTQQTSENSIDTGVSKNSSKSTILNPSYTFESFVVGSSNQFAYTAALRVAEKPGVQYNPLFIYGGAGLGKTHLLHAIGNFNLARNKQVIFTSLEQFMNQFTHHLRNGTMDRFRDKYRSCDILLLDDIQFLSRKEETQKELFHTFNELHGNGKQIVMTSDQHPKKIAGLEERLRSRFEWGLIVDIQPPELETKIAIIKKKCELNGIHIDNEIVNYIAANMGNNIREIEGIIIQLNAFANMMNQSITLEFAKNVVKNQIKERSENITIDDIVKVASRELNVKPSEIKSKSRSRKIVEARRIVIYLARSLTPNSMPSLAQYFGMKDHTAVSHAMKKINEMIDKDENFKAKIEELSHKITSATVE
ncbi:chromosomal replication initiator protein DnaA [Hydrogenimonas thermophila]|uniref:chromosomal replication initiator protein DnaA n=1 Tax=Hydrogenimonas thermophila TaxID=223786 RepID=UPI002936FDC9|nr:chromosomal replication initiator protein DnaA [Hydrogenimonas thermophila]WOE69989.1 chromosomal replication initiator protein DnaA [Hydrogenimonas thermophila]WOE72506.1 chromosomal replication initiator protein DnaA [Hydrogenimonas thermophila]